MSKLESESSRPSGEDKVAVSSTAATTGSGRVGPVDDGSGSGTDGSSGGRVILDSVDETAQLVKQLTIGTVIDGKYKIDQIIGRGAMGVVVAATHVHLREKVALKFLSARPNPHSSDFHSRFRREAQVSAKLRNEHITRVIDVGVWRDLLPFMVMDHLTGDDLRRTLKNAGRIPVATALDYIVQICEGLAEAHAIGIVHRDLKPSNLFVTRRPDGSELIKILDFGISKWSQGEEQLDELTQTGVVLGSPKYMAPEQLFGSSDVDARADVWSIGAIFYEMLAGRPPFDFPTLTRICAELATDKPPPPLSSYGADVPPQLEIVLLHCFARDRDKRIRNVAELAGALLDAVDAPFADAVRNKISAMLEPKGTGAAMTTSSGGMSLSGGSYLSLSMTGSTPGRMSSSSAIRVALEAGAAPPAGSLRPAGGVDSAAGGSEGKRKVIVAASILAVLLLAGAFLFFLSGRHPDAAATRPMPGPSFEPTPPPAATAAASSAALSSPSTSANEPPPPAASAVVPAATVAQPAPPHGGGGGWHPHHPAGHPAPPPTATTPPPAVTPSPAPAPTPPPQPTTKANPLEDRQ